MKEQWEERGRTNLRTDQGKHAYTGRGHRHQQVGGKQSSRTEGRQTEEPNEAEGRNTRYDELPCRGELDGTAGEAMEAHPEQEAFML